METSYPGDPAGFRSRLLTFKASTWVAKPEELSPVVCARHGWRNFALNAVRCDVCGAVNAFGHYGLLNDPWFGGAVKRFSKELRSGHESHCTFRGVQDPRDFHVHPWPEGPVAREAFRGRVGALMRIWDLPDLCDTALEMMRAAPGGEGLERLAEGVRLEYLAGDGGNAGGQGKVWARRSLAACAMALFGWEVRLVNRKGKRALGDASMAEIEAAGYSRRSEVAVCCEMCGARAGLWRFRSGCSAGAPKAPFPVVQQLAASVAAVVARRRPAEGAGQGASKEGCAAARLTGTIAGGAMQAAGGGVGAFATPRKTSGAGSSSNGGAGVGESTPAPFGSVFGKGGGHGRPEATPAGVGSENAFGSARASAAVFGLHSFKSGGKRKFGDAMNTLSETAAKTPRLLSDAASAAKDVAQAVDAPRAKATMPYAFGNAILKALNSSPATSAISKTSVGRDQETGNGPGGKGEVANGNENGRFDAGCIAHTGSASRSKLSRAGGAAACELPAFHPCKEHRYWCPWIRQYRSRIVEHEISGWCHLLELLQTQKVNSCLPAGTEIGRKPDKALVDAECRGYISGEADRGNVCKRKDMLEVQDASNDLAGLQEPVQTTPQNTVPGGSAVSRGMANIGGRRADSVSRSNDAKTLALQTSAADSAPTKDDRGMHTGLFAIASAGTTINRHEAPPVEKIDLKSSEPAENGANGPKSNQSVFGLREGEMQDLQTSPVAGNLEEGKAKVCIGDSGISNGSNREQDAAPEPVEVELQETAEIPATVVAPKPVEVEVLDTAEIPPPVSASPGHEDPAEQMPGVPVQDSPPAPESPDDGGLPEPPFGFQQEAEMDPHRVVQPLVEPEFIPVNDIRVHIAEDSGETQGEGEESESEDSVDGWSDEDVSEDRVRESASSAGHDLDLHSMEGHQAHAQILMNFGTRMMQAQLERLQQPLREEPEIVDLATPSDEDVDNNGQAEGEPDMEGEAERWRQGHHGDPMGNEIYGDGGRGDVRDWINGDGFELDESSGDEEGEEGSQEDYYGDDDNFEQWGNGPLGRMAEQAPGQLVQEQVVQAQVGQGQADHVFEAREEEAEDEESSVEEDASSEELNQMFPDMGRPQAGSQDDDNGREP